LKERHKLLNTLAVFC